MRWNRRKGLLVVLAVIVLAEIALIILRSTTDSPTVAVRPSDTATSTRPASAATATGATPTPSTGTTPSGVRTTSPVTSTPPPLGAGLAASTGPGLTEVGIHVLAQPGANGAIEVLEQLRLRSPVAVLDITAPVVAGIPGLVGAQPAVAGLRMTADGAPVILPVGEPTTSGRVALAYPATAISLRYRLEGAIARVSPSPVGRVLLAISPIAAKGRGQLPVVVQVIGPGVRNLVCPRLSTGAQLCGREQGSVWSTPAMPADLSLVVAQVDLPPVT